MDINSKTEEIMKSIKETMTEELVHKTKLYKERLIDVLKEGSIKVDSSSKLIEAIDVAFFKKIEENIEKRIEELKNRIAEVSKHRKIFLDKGIEAEKANSRTNVRLNKQIRIVNFDLERELVSKLVKQITIGLENKMAELGEDRTDDIINIRGNVSYTLNKYVSELEEEYVEVLKQQMELLKDMYATETLESEVTNEETSKVSASDINKYDSVLSIVGLRIYEKDEKVLLGTTEDNAIDVVKDKDGTIRTLDNKVVLMEQSPNVYDIYESESDTIVETMDDLIGEFRLCKRNGGFEVRLEPDFLDYNIKIDNKECKTPEEKLKALLLIKKDYPKVFEQMQLNILFSNYFKESGYKEEMTLSDEEYNEMVAMKQKKQKEETGVLASLDIKDDPVNINETKSNDSSIKSMMEELTIGEPLIESNMYDEEKSKKFLKEMYDEIYGTGLMNADDMPIDESLQQYVSFVDSDGLPFDINRKVM